MVFLFIELLLLLFMLILY